VDKLQITKVQPIARRRLCTWLRELNNPLEAWAIAMRLDVSEAIVSEKRRFITADTTACLKKFPDNLKAIPIEEYAALIQTKEDTIQRAWQCVLETFTCLRDSDMIRVFFPPTNCAYCIAFLHYCRLTTKGGQILRPKAMDMETLHRCHSFAGNHKCISHGYESHRDESALVRLQLKFRQSISTILSEIS